MLRQGYGQEVADDILKVSGSTDNAAAAGGGVSLVEERIHP
jgi:hypothetical protein